MVQCRPAAGAASAIHTSDAATFRGAPMRAAPSSLPRSRGVLRRGGPGGSRTRGWPGCARLRGTCCKRHSFGARTRGMLSGTQARKAHPPGNHQKQSPKHALGAPKWSMLRGARQYPVNELLRTKQYRWNASAKTLGACTLSTHSEHALATTGALSGDVGPPLTAEKLAGKVLKGSCQHPRREVAECARHRCPRTKRQRP